MHASAFSSFRSSESGAATAPGTSDSTALVKAQPEPSSSRLNRKRRGLTKAAPVEELPFAQDVSGWRHPSDPYRPPLDSLDSRSREASVDSYSGMSGPPALAKRFFAKNWSADTGYFTNTERSFAENCEDEAEGIREDITTIFSFLDDISTSGSSASGTSRNERRLAALRAHSEGEGLAPCSDHKRSGLLPSGHSCDSGRGMFPEAEPLPGAPPSTRGHQQSSQPCPFPRVLRSSSSMGSQKMPVRLNSIPESADHSPAWSGGYGAEPNGQVDPRYPKSGEQCQVSRPCQFGPVDASTCLDGANKLLGCNGGKMGKAPVDSGSKMGPEEPEQLKLSVSQLVMRVGEIERKLESLTGVKQEVTQVLDKLNQLDGRMQWEHASGRRNSCSSDISADMAPPPCARAHTCTQSRTPDMRTGRRVRHSFERRSRSFNEADAPPQHLWAAPPRESSIGDLRLARMHGGSEHALWAMGDSGLSRRSLCPSALYEGPGRCGPQRGVPYVSSQKGSPYTPLLSRSGTVQSLTAIDRLCPSHRQTSFTSPARRAVRTQSLEHIAPSSVWSLSEEPWNYPPKMAPEMRKPQHGEEWPRTRQSDTWQDDGVAYHMLMRRKSERRRRSRRCKLIVLVVLAMCTLVLVIVVPICTSRG
uniref:uncharacterized protein n=1 Tax=Myxine glutinosa TaxID=7769 RepID=UPI00358FC528